jgi:type VI secretion system secreted protein Hcp
MAIDTHIKFDGVDGESTHKTTKVRSRSCPGPGSVSNVNAGAPSAAVRVKARATPAMTSTSCTPTTRRPRSWPSAAPRVHFPTVVLTARKSGEGQKDFLKVTMKEVFITSVQPSGSSQGDIVESVSMSYGSVDFSYKAQDDKGALGGEVKYGWNVKTTVVT